MSDQVAITGPVGYREFVLDKACDSHRGHVHHYDHATFIHRGRVRIEAGDTAREYAAGQWVDIPANLSHTIVALEDHTVYFCIFSHRDFDGIVAQAFTGNEEAYT